MTETICICVTIIIVSAYITSSWRLRYCYKGKQVDDRITADLPMLNELAEVLGSIVDAKEFNGGADELLDARLKQTEKAVLMCIIMRTAIVARADCDEEPKP